MRVLCFGRFYDDIPGGMQRHIEHLFRSLRGTVDFVHLVPSRQGRGSIGSVEGFPLIRTPSLNVDGSVALSPALFSAARRLHREHAFDLVHLHFPDPMTHLASLALPAAIPRVISWHAEIIKYPRALSLYRPLLRRSIDSAAAVIVATEGHVSSSPELSRLQDGTRVHVIPYGFDLAPYQSAAPGREELVRRFPGRRIFALGRHVYYKGFDLLIRAIGQLPSDVQLIVGGAGPLTERWQSLAAELGLADRVHFVGLISDEDLPAYYQAADLFCLPATCEAEAFGIVQVEAMAAGVPVVSSALANGVSMVNRHGETGLLVAPNDVPALVQALARLLSDEPLRAQLGAAAQRWASSQFSLEEMGRRTLAVYQQCLASGRMQVAQASGNAWP